MGGERKGWDWREGAGIGGEGEKREGRGGKVRERRVPKVSPPPLKNPRSATDIRRRRCSAVCCSAAANIMTAPPSSNGGGKQHRHAAAGPMGPM